MPDLKFKLHAALGPDADATVANCLLLQPQEMAALVTPLWQVTSNCLLPPPLSIPQRLSLHPPFAPAPHDTVAAFSTMLRRAVTIAAEIQAELGKSADPGHLDTTILRRMEAGRLRLLSAEVAQGATDGILIIDATLKGTSERVIEQVVHLIHEPRRPQTERLLRRGRWLYALDLAQQPGKKAQAARKETLKGARAAEKTKTLARGKVAAARARAEIAGKSVPAAVEILARGEPPARPGNNPRSGRRRESGTLSSLQRLALAATSPALVGLLDRPDWQDALIGSCLAVDPRLIAAQCDLLARIQGEVRFPMLSTETRRQLAPTLGGPVLALSRAISVVLQGDPEVALLTGATPDLYTSLLRKRDELVRLREGGLRLAVASADGVALLDEGLRRTSRAMLGWVNERIDALPEYDPRRVTLLSESAAARDADDRGQAAVAARRAEGERRNKTQREDEEAHLRQQEAIETLYRASAGEDVEPVALSEALACYREAAAAEEEAAALAFAGADARTAER